MKYVLLGFFAYAIGNMSAKAIAQFLESPYALVVDLRMLNFFRYLNGAAAYIVLGLAIASILVQNFWCRYLCPYGAFLGIASLLSPLRITRTESTCIDCGKCAKACPSSLPVDKLVQIRSAECTACLECIAICPATDTLMPFAPYGLKKRRALSPWTIAAAIAVIFLGLVAFAKAAGRWETPFPKQVYLQLVPAASERHHPWP